MVKKAFSIMLVISMLLSLAACASNTESAAQTPSDSPAETVATPSQTEKEKITIQIWGTETEYLERHNAFMARYPEWADKVEVEFVSSGDHDSDQATKFRLQIASGEMPDVILLQYSQALEFAAQENVLIDIEKYVSDYIPLLIDGVSDVMQCDGRYVGYPDEIKGCVFFYRTDIFSECGVDPTLWKTVDDMIAGGKLIQEKYPDSYIENYTASPVFENDPLIYLSMTNGSYQAADGTYDCETDENVAAAFELMKKMYDSGVVNTDIVEWSTDWTESFGNNTLVSQIIGTWFKKRIMEFVPEQAGLWSSCLLPDEIRNSTDGYAAVFCVTSACENPDLVCQYLSEVYFDEEAQKDYYYGQYMKTPLLQSLADDDEFLSGLDNDFFTDLSVIKTEFASYGVLNPLDYSYNTAAENSIVSAGALSKYLLGELSLEEALKQADLDLTNQIGNAYNK
jgi:multiple sugar transport system substrate-binding protein